VIGVGLMLPIPFLIETVITREVFTITVRNCVVAGFGNTVLVSNLVLSKEIQCCQQCNNRIGVKEYL
jgi:hypothetical protein